MADITAQTIDKIIELARPELVQVDGRNYATGNLKGIDDPRPAPLTVHTLTGLIEFYGSNFDGIDPLPIFHVESHGDVKLLSAVGGPFKNRTVYCHADNLNATNFRFGSPYSLEDFIVAIQSQFVPNETTAAILKVIGNIKEENVTNWSDDGVTQAVTAKAGVALVEKLPVPNPIMLRPYRTFLEVEQPELPFVFRLKSGSGAPTCSIHEADGGLWKLTAINSISAWLRDKMPGSTIIA